MIHIPLKNDFFKGNSPQQLPLCKGNPRLYEPPLIKKVLGIIILLNFLLLTAGDVYAAWYDSNWGYRKKITVQAGQVNSAQSNFPMLINTTDSDWRDTANGGKVGQSDGGDILFTSSDGITKLSHEIEIYTPSTGTLVAWVNVTSVSSSSNTEIYIYYGNAGASDQWDTNGNTWNSNYGIVYHMDASGTDLTSNNRDRMYDVGSPTADNTFLGYGLSFDGNDAWDQTDLEGSGGYWEQTWDVRSHEIVFETGSDVNTRQTIFAEGGSINGVMLYILSGNLYARWWSESQGWNGDYQSTGISANNIYHVILSYEYPGGDYELFVNGSSTGSTGTAVTMSSHGGNGGIAYTGPTSKDFHDLDDSQGHYFIGSIYEFRVRDNKTDSGYATTTYNNQNSPSTFYSLDCEENEDNTRYWVGTAGGAWADNSSWSITSGGGGGACYPVAGDTAIFDGNGTNNITLAADAEASAITNTGGYTGIFDTGDFDITLTGNFQFDEGTFNAGNSTIRVGGDFDFAGGTFTQGSSTVTLDGGNQNISGSTTFYNLTKTVTSAATLTFDNTATQTITNTLTLNGAGGQLLLLRSDSAGNQWDIDPQGTRNISYLDVQDSNNINTTWILSVNSASSGNNTGWYFGNHIMDVDSDGTDELAMDADGNSANGYELYSDPDCPTPGPGKICSSAVLSTDGDRDIKTDHFIDTSGDATPEKWWDPDEYVIQDIELIDVNRDGSDEWVYDSDNNGTFDFAYNRSGSRFIDPFGVVFDSATNNEIAGAEVTIYRSATGIPAVPGTDLAGGDVNPVITGANGTYGFNAVAGDYYITVKADGYGYPFEPANKTFDTGRTICVNNTAAGYPSAACQGQYGSRGEVFTVAAIITMDHPLDPTRHLIKLTKNANKAEANTGDIVTYTITIENKTTTEIKNVYITDKIPPGFKYITGRTILDNQKTDNPEGQRPVTFNIKTIEAGQKRILQYQLIIGSGVTFSKYENSAWANSSNGTRMSNVATEEVKIIPEPLFDLGTVIGKVFLDRNENGVQESSQFTVHSSSTTDNGQQSPVTGESGIANVRIVTEEGMIITTGKDGKYHLAGITPGRHILRIDERTLPEGAYLTTDKAVIIDITPGILTKVNFGVNNHHVKNREIKHKGEKISPRQKGIETDRVSDDKLFDDFVFVGLADIKAGHTDVSGNIEAVGNDNSFKSGFWSEGRLAYYLKGKIKGKYLITSSIDTNRGEKELFRKLDPDKYYPVYGDASTVNHDATNTQGMLYLAIEWDKNKAMWGNYRTEITDAELAQFNRTLYGGKLHYETVSTSKAGEPVTKLLIFYAHAKQKAAHNEFLGTGGSLYYLKHRPIVEGSEKIVVEIRDKNTGLIIAEVEQSEGDDYEIDYSNGRIMFYLPVSQTAKSNTIISTAILDGNPLYIVVDYEYEVNDLTYDESSYGGRAEQSLMGLINKFRTQNQEHRTKNTESSRADKDNRQRTTDSGKRTTLNEYNAWLKDIRLGGTYIKDNTDKYELKGIDLSAYLGEHTKITGEYAMSKDQGKDGFISTDGGLSFALMDNFSLTEISRGKALSLKSETYLFDRLNIKAYHKRVDKGFSSTSTLSGLGKQITGGDATLEITPETRLKLSYDTQKLLDGGNALTALQTGARRTDTSNVQITHDMDKLKLTGEYRHIDVKEKSEIYESETNLQGDTAAFRADYIVKKDLNVFVEQQTTLKGKENHQTTGGVSARLFGRLQLNVQHTKGSKGTATSIGTIAKIDSKTELYNTYSTNRPYIDGRKRTITTGARNKITESMNLTTETRQSTSGTEDSRTNNFGLSGKINDRWGMSGGFESGTVQSVSGSISKRNAGSIGVSYIEKERINTSVRLEIRKDDGDEDRQQYLSYNAAHWKVNRNTTLFGKINLSERKNTTLDTTEARYKELVFGGAYRPVNIDRLNMLAKYTYLEDKTASGQSDMSDIEEQRAHVIAGEAVYDLTDKWQVIEKLALKQADEKVIGFDFTKTQTWLWINRVNYNLYRKWQVGAEYRVLGQKQAKDMKHGVLIEVARYIGKNILIGAGYNFTDFNDDLTYLDYTSQGPFIRLSAKITD